jgi:hypothetical protein
MIPTMLAGEKTKKRKLKYLCILCMKDHPNHLFPWLAKDHKILVKQEPAVLTNPFPHGQNMAQASSSSSVEAKGSQGPPTATNNNSTTNI